MEKQAEQFGMYGFSLQDSAQKSSRWTPSFVFRHHMGIGKHW
jgi:hypothetical protein